jgi:hypothetical protein
LSIATIAVIGVPLYNAGDHLGPALRSLLGQTEQRLALVLVDDCSTDGTPERAERIIAGDPRATLVRNERRLGLVGNWRRCFMEGVARYPDAPYFAWGSDHDLWNAHWLERLVEALEACPECVLAYPYSERIDSAGDVLGPHRRYTNIELTDPMVRFTSTFYQMKAGNLIYGLFRTAEVARAGIFRQVLLPDRMLLAELSIDGRFAEVPQMLWQRRQLGQATIARQRRTLFSDPPAHVKLPWWAQHIGAFAWAHAVKNDGRHGRLSGLAWSARYAYIATRFQGGRRFRTTHQRLRLLKKRTKKLVIRRVLVPGGRLRASTLDHMRLPSRSPEKPPDPALVEPVPPEPPAAESEPAAEFYSRPRTAVERRLEELLLELGSTKKAVQSGMQAIGSIEKSLSASRGAIVRQEGARVRIDDPAFLALARPVVDAERTMLSLPRLYTLYNGVRNAAAPGLAAVEVGTFRGGTAYFVASAMAARLGAEAPVYVMDTFEGHPEEKVSAERDPEQAIGSFFETSEEDVRAYLADFERVQVIAGEAVANLASLPEQQYAVVHLDVDLYLPTLECLRYFIDRIAPRGVIVVDDYGAPSCPGIVEAVEEFRTERDDVQCWPMLTEQALVMRR